MLVYVVDTPVFVVRSAASPSSVALGVLLSGDRVLNQLQRASAESVDHDIDVLALPATPVHEVLLLCQLALSKDE